LQTLLDPVVAVASSFCLFSPPCSVGNAIELGGRMMRREGLPTGGASSLTARIAVVVALAGVVAVAACDGYEGFGENEEGLGPVDPVTFPAANLGSAGNRTQPGVGLFQETAAFADGAILGYFPYLYPSTTIPDYLRIRENNAANARVPTIGAYVFDPTGMPPSPLPGMQRCSPPGGYVYDEVRDEVRYDQQGSVFAALPRATYNMGEAPTTAYVPVVAEWPANSSNQPCQRFKSRIQTEKLFPVQPSGKFMAWLIIDPAAAVYKHTDDPDMDMRGLELQKWGWFNRYLVAYLDGGYIPTVDETITEGTPPMMKQVVRMRPQTLYYPRSPVIGMNAAGMPTMAAGQRGAGYDVLDAKRGDGDYSPVCKVVTYDAGMPLAPAQLPKRAEDIMAMFGPTIMDAAVPYIFCLQVR
jgi:hypothetical protein